MATQHGTSPNPADEGRAGPPADGAGTGAASLDYLLAQVARGDRDAFAFLYDQAAGPVYSLLCQLTGSPARAQDLTGQVLTEVWRTAPLFSPSAGSGMSWIMAIARRHGVGQLRAERAGASAGASAGAFQRPEVRRIIQELADRAGVSPCRKPAPAGLTPPPEAPGQALLLVYYGGYTEDQVAGLLGVPPAAVSAWIRAGLRKLSSGPEW